MLAVGLTFALFLFWGLVGYGFLSALHPRRNPLQDLLLAPVFGLAVTVLCVFLFNWMGWPIGKFGPALAVVLAAVSGILLWRLRPETSWRGYGPFAGLFVLAVLLSGRPMLEFGFDWLSYCNDDMANYCLGAQRVLNHGFADAPDKDELVEGRDYTQCYWFMYVPNNIRPGSELILAWVVSLTGLTVHQAFMPVIFAFYLLLLSSAGALVCQASEYRGQALLTCLLVALSALTTLGCVYQLIAQVVGLALLAGCCIVVLRPYAELDLRSGLRVGLCAGILIPAILLVYPEVFPFFVIALALYLSLAWWKKALAWRPVLAAALTATAAVPIVFNTYTLKPLLFFVRQAELASTKDRRILGEIFPYYLMPSGLANFWGLTPIGGDPTYDFGLSVKIVLGACLLLAALVAVVVLVRRTAPIAFPAVGMLAFAAPLFLRSDGFALFKLVMFLQPFLLGAMATAWCAAFRWRVLRVAPLLVLGLLGVFSQWGYVNASRGIGAAFVEIPNPSGSHLLTEFRDAVAAAPVRRVVLDSFNSCLVKYQVVYLRGIPSAAPGSSSAFRGVVHNVYSGQMSLDPVVQKIGDDLEAAWSARTQSKARFELHDPANPKAFDFFDLDRVGRPPSETTDGVFLIGGAGRLSPLNRRRCPATERSFIVRPWNEVHDHLIFASSALGRHYYTDVITGAPIALYQLEGDFMFPGKTMAACGRIVLFEVVHPSPKARMLLETTATVRGDGECRLPPAAAVGSERIPFPIVGRGSARVFSPPLTAQRIDELAFVGLDLGVDATRNSRDRREGLMKLYGRDVPIDRRKYAAFVRDVSLVSEEDYAGLKPPAVVERFPADLENPDLEYSGMYEDGWCSEQCWCGLSQPEGQDEVVVRGQVPRLDDPEFTTEMTVSIDGQEAVRRTLSVGDFEVAAKAPPGTGRRRVEVHFSRFQRLPGGDDRPVGAMLKCIGFLAIPDTAARP